MTVGELLNRISSRELTEWYAYEQVHGPIGDAWRDETLAAVHEQLQLLNHLTGQAHFTDKKHRKGPVNKPEHYPRPDEVFGERKPERPDEQTDLDDEEGWIMPPSFGSNRDDDEEDG